MVAFLYHLLNVMPVAVEPISHQFSISIPSENVKKPDDFRVCRMGTLA